MNKCMCLDVQMMGQVKKSPQDQPPISHSWSWRRNPGDTCGKTPFASLGMLQTYTCPRGSSKRTLQIALECVLLTEMQRQLLLFFFPFELYIKELKECSGVISPKARVWQTLMTSSNLIPNLYTLFSSTSKLNILSNLSFISFIITKNIFVHPTKTVLICKTKSQSIKNHSQSEHSVGGLWPHLHSTRD